MAIGPPPLDGRGALLVPFGVIRNLAHIEYIPLADRILVPVRILIHLLQNVVDLATTFVNGAQVPDPLVRKDVGATGQDLVLFLGIVGQGIQAYHRTADPFCIGVQGRVRRDLLDPRHDLLPGR